MPTILTSPNYDKLNTELEAGKCIGLPTETVYGLAADATNGMAVAKIFEMKGRPKFNPLICHVADMRMAREHGVFNAVAEKLAEAFWPGPLTIVLPLKDESGIHPLVSAELGTIGLRCPKGAAAEVIAKFGKPLAAPSANRSGRVSPTTAHHVAEEFPESDLVIVDSGACETGIESTIVKIEGDNIRLLRPGSITAEMVEAVTGIIPEFAVSDKIEAPGMMQSHYAPDARVLLNQKECIEGSAFLAFGPVNNQESATHIFNLSQSGNLQEAAANLYAGLKYLDTTGTETISVSPIPSDGLGLAINDRLNRAAAPRSIT